MAVKTIIFPYTAANLFSFEGRIGRARFWTLNALCVPALVPSYFSIMLTINQSTTAAFVLVVIGVFIFFATCAAILSIGVRRLHDRGKSSFWLIVYYPALLLVMTGEYDGNGLALIAIAFAVSVWAIFDLGFMPSVFTDAT